MALGTGAARDMQFFKPLAEEGVCVPKLESGPPCAPVCVSMLHLPKVVREPVMSLADCQRFLVERYPCFATESGHLFANIWHSPPCNSMVACACAFICVLEAAGNGMSRWAPTWTFATSMLAWEMLRWPSKTWDLKLHLWTGAPQLHGFIYFATRTTVLICSS